VILPPGSAGAEAAVFAVVLVALVLFVHGLWRYDLVAMIAALALTLVGVIPPDRLFAGFGHPAVITVAAVLIVSRGLQNSGLVEVLARWLDRVGNGITLQVAALSTLVAVSSAFMNNVGALALFLPVAVRLARSSGVSPSALLMPIAFASLLGGMVTLIGTPPNIIIATFREDAGLEAYRMFDFAPVGLGVMIAGVIFIALIGWRLLPLRDGESSQEDLFEIQEYTTEVRLPEGSGLVGTPLFELSQLTDGDLAVVALVRGDECLPGPRLHATLREGDILLLKADSEALADLSDDRKVELVGDQSLGMEALSSDEVSVLEAVVRPDSRLVGRTAKSMNLHWLERVNLLAVARRGARITDRLAEIRFEPGDVLLLQVKEDEVQETLQSLGCLPLAERGLRVGRPRRIFMAVGVFGAAMAMTSSGILPVTVAFTLAALGMTLLRLVPVREVYTSIDWPVIVLLAAMLPVGEALEVTGGADRIGSYILMAGGILPAAGTVALLLVGTMFLSDLVNNAAAVVLMAPIALTVAAGLDASPDPFLMAIAVGGSAAFLTPIGHQSNILVMGPGGYRFGDYWRMGLPLEIVTLAVALPLILIFWPL